MRAVILGSCPSIVRSSRPVLTSHNLTEASLLPLANSLPSGLRTTVLMLVVCPVCTTSSGFCASARVDSRQTRMAPVIFQLFSSIVHLHLESFFELGESLTSQMRSLEKRYLGSSFSISALRASIS